MPLIKPSFRDTKPGWYASHRRHINSVIRQQAEVVLIGASLVANLSRYPSVWDRHLKPLNAVNCGIGGDCTQHALWRVDHMYLPASGSVVVIHCGSNNMDFNVYKPIDIAQSVVSIGSKLRERNPHLKVIVAGILPRDPGISKRRLKTQQTNEILEKLCWEEDFLYIGKDGHWVADSGKLKQSLYYKDNLHLNKEGCNLFATQIENSVRSVLSTPSQSPSPSLPTSHSSPSSPPLPSSSSSSPPSSSPSSSTSSPPSSPPS